MIPVHQDFQCGMKKEESILFSLHCLIIIILKVTFGLAVNLDEECAGTILEISLLRLNL